MRSEEILAKRLASEIKVELAALRRLLDELSNAPAGRDVFSLRGRASILHDVYTAVERVFVRVAEELNGGVPKGDSWHRQLLLDMTLEVAGVRPAVISPVLADKLSELLRFRHVFRNVYGFVLEAKRLELLESECPRVVDGFVTEVEGFLAWMTGTPGNTE